MKPLPLDQHFLCLDDAIHIGNDAVYGGGSANWKQIR
jgi:hypothetical protein